MRVSKEELIRLLDTYTWPQNRIFCLREEGAITESNKAPTYMYLLLPIPLHPPHSISSLYLASFLHHSIIWLMNVNLQQSPSPQNETVASTSQLPKRTRSAGPRDDSNHASHEPETTPEQANASKRKRKHPSQGKSSDQDDSLDASMGKRRTAEPQSLGKRRTLQQQPSGKTTRKPRSQKPPRQQNTEQVRQLLFSVARTDRVSSRTFGSTFQVLGVFNRTRNLEPLTNSPFQSCLLPLFQSKDRCKVFHMKISFIQIQLWLVCFLFKEYNVIHMCREKDQSDQPVRAFKSSPLVII